MNNNLECAKYIKSKPGLDRMMLELKKQWKKLGHCGGTIIISNSSEEERRDIGRLLGEKIMDSTIKFKFKTLDSVIQKTKFAPVDFEEVLTYYFEKEIITNKQQKHQQDKDKEAFFERLYSIAQSDNSKDWLKSVKSEKQFGYMSIIREYNDSAENALKLMENIIKAYDRLCIQDSENMPLAVFASKITGNPHFFDRGMVSSQILMNAICYGKKIQYPENTHSYKQILVCCGIIPDTISSLVHVYGLRFKMGEEYHKAYDSFVILHEPYVLTMENLVKLTVADAEGKKIYIVENEMVFTALLQNKPDCVIICTSGQFKTAGLSLIDMLISSGNTINYSSDLDPEGIDMANRLYLKYGERINFWRMSKEDYIASISNETISEVRLSKLNHINCGYFEETNEIMRQKKRAGYQENILEYLIQDVMQGQSL